jgi:hypothetical protein
MNDRKISACLGSGLCPIVCLVLLVLLTPPAWAQATKNKAELAGTVLLAIGEVRALRNGVAVVLIKGSSIQSGDMVTTGNSSNAQLRMSDGAIIALRAQTEFKIDEYQFNGKADGSEKAVLSLVKGGVRAVTGAIGKQNADNLKINAVVATVGIRGTGFNLNYCQGNCVNPDKTVAKDGLYAGVFEGQITVKNEVAQDVLGVNEYLYVGARNEMPKSLTDPPNFLPDPLAGQKAAKSKGRNSGGEIPSLAVGVSPPVKPADQQVGPPSSPLPIEMGVVVSYPPSITTALVPTTWYNKPNQGDGSFPPAGATNFVQSALVGLQTTIGADGLPVHSIYLVPPNTAASLTTSPYGASTLTPSSSGGYTYVSSITTTGNGFSMQRLTAQQMEGGNYGGIVSWGRWANGTVSVSGYGTGYTVDANNGLHYIAGTRVNPGVNAGNYTFNLVGATTPTAIANMQGGWLVTGGSMNVNFANTGSNAITGNLGLYANQAGGSGFFNMNFNGPVAPIASGNSVAVSVAKTSGNLNICAPSCAGSGNVAFYGAGTTPQAAGLVYKFDTGGNAVQGAAVFK